MARHPSVEYIRFRTDGNAARKVEVAAPIKTIRLPRAKKQKRPRPQIDVLSLTAIVMTVVMAVCMLVGLRQLNVAQQETAAMQKKVEALQAENDMLWTYYDENLDMDQIERTAMALGMIPKDQATCITVQVASEAVEEQPNVWERVTLFLTGFFA